MTQFNFDALFRVVRSPSVKYILINRLCFSLFFFRDMLENSSSTNDSFFKETHFLSDPKCIFSSPGSSIYTTFIALDTCTLLPICLLVLYYAHQRILSASTSHSDCFTYHMVAMDLVVVLRNAVACYSIHRGDIVMLYVSTYLSSFTWCGQMSLHMLQCMERYLAVVHPITYLSLKTEAGIRIRKITISCVWLISLMGLGLTVLKGVYIMVDLFLLLVSVTVVSFCSLSVLYVLNRPGPGKPVGGKRTGDQSKRRAFYTIVIILGVLCIKLAWLLVWVIYYFSKVGNACGILLSEFLFSLPCSLVLPVLYLHRAGNPTCCRCKP